MAVVTYGNRAYEDALLELKLKLEERNFVVRAAAAFIGEHSVSRNIANGRPDQKDLGIAFEYGGMVARYVQSDACGTLVVPGSYPFAAKGSDPHYVPSTSSACISCGLCARNCPYEALDTEDFKTVDKTKCMRCGRCVKYCPSNAKVFDDPDFLAKLPEFEARLNSNACQPGLFLPSSH